LEVEEPTRLGVRNPVSRDAMYSVMEDGEEVDGAEGSCRHMGLRFHAVGLCFGETSFGDVLCEAK
jgi:hypothetical protein